MTAIHLISVFMGPALLLLASVLPACFVAGGPRGRERVPMLAVLAALIMAIVSSYLLAVHGTLDAALIGVAWPLPISIGTYFDSLTATMLVLVTFIGLVIVRYSGRYLDGDPNQPKFMRLICLTLGSVSLLIVSGNIFMFAIAWLMTGFSLHSLLTYYPDRPAAITTARKKFVISRLGDLMLVVAIVICYQLFGSFEYGQMFQEAKQISASESTQPGSASHASTLLSLASIFLVIGAMTKSAQFPFHSWLPDTLETPTPVSALMHAGIINAGGFLVIRLSPLIANSSIALNLLAIFGGITAVLGVICMMPQTSIKRSLAYSTMAQMGFMMLQCGLGAFSAALLHIVAHSLYKAYAFLSSGSVLDSQVRPKLAPRDVPYSSSLLQLAAAIAVATGVITVCHVIVEYLAIEKLGSWVLNFVLLLALTQLLWSTFTSRNWSVVLRGIAASILVAMLYTSLYLGFDAILSYSESYMKASFTFADMLIMFAVALGFFLVFVLQILVKNYGTTRSVAKLYISASNGFYFDILVHRIVNRIYGRSPLRHV